MEALWPTVVAATADQVGGFDDVDWFRKVSSAAVICSIVCLQAASAQARPESPVRGVAPGMPYSQARRIMFKAGYGTYQYWRGPALYARCPSGREEVCSVWVEAASCSEARPLTCRFLLIKGASVVAVVARGEPMERMRVSSISRLTRAEVGRYLPR